MEHMFEVVFLKPNSTSLFTIMDLRDSYWGGGVQAFEILKLLNGTNSGGLVISSRCWPTTYHATG